MLKPKRFRHNSGKFKRSLKFYNYLLTVFLLLNCTLNQLNGLRYLKRYHIKCMPNVHFDTPPHVQPRTHTKRLIGGYNHPYKTNEKYHPNWG